MKTVLKLPTSAQDHKIVNHAISSALCLLGLSPLRHLTGWVDHRGLILMFHHIGAAGDESLVNRGLTVSPETLDQVLDILAAREYELVSMDEVPDRLTGTKRFAALTFDDGCCDNLTCAAPVLVSHGAPFTVYVTTGFADGTVYPWWHVLERAITAASKLEVKTVRGVRCFDTESPAGKIAAAIALREILLTSPPDLQAKQTCSLARQAKIDLPALTRELYLDWEGLRALAKVPGCTIGAHTLTHPRLAQLGAEELWSELADSRTIIEERLGVQIRHFSYPYGMAAACGDREFELAGRLGYVTAVTTRHDVLTPRNADALTSLPRVPINGNFEHPLMLEGLISGLPLFSLARRAMGRSENVAC
jgi:peptidoglycan/xylan/chitin deacetylase (PgdA/CDA1 family)